MVEVDALYVMGKLRTTGVVSVQFLGGCPEVLHDFKRLASLETMVWTLLPKEFTDEQNWQDDCLFATHGGLGIELADTSLPTTESGFSVELLHRDGLHRVGTNPLTGQCV